MVFSAWDLSSIVILLVNYILILALDGISGICLIFYSEDDLGILTELILFGLCFGILCLRMAS